MQSTVNQQCHWLRVHILIFKKKKKKLEKESDVTWVQDTQN